jgi:hypothetical protein
VETNIVERILDQVRPKAELHVRTDAGYVDFPAPLGRKPDAGAAEARALLIALRDTSYAAITTSFLLHAYCTAQNDAETRSGLVDLAAFVISTIAEIDRRSGQPAKIAAPDGIKAFADMVAANFPEYNTKTEGAYAK